MEPYRIGVCVVVLNDSRTHVLLGKRLNSYKAGMLGIPGGRVEVKETILDCGERELLEETSLKSQKLEYLGAIRELQDGEYNFVHFAFACSEFEGTPTTVEPDKCEGWEWYPLNDLPDGILPGHKAAIDMYLDSDTPYIEILG